ncbi:MAG: pentapeptide repeat-containing protein, partial [Chloroflexi bacterium]|nr:pentapeptide repeat-containing protein [Chloroflexota bacterium]
LTFADLREADLDGADLYGADLHGANLDKAVVGWTGFRSVDLSMVKGLDNVYHLGPSTVDIDTIYLSKGQIPEAFLSGTGVPNELINYLERIKTPECPYTLEQLDERIMNQQKRLTIVSRNLDDRKEVKALYGPLNVPLSLNNEIRELEMEQQAIQTDIVEYQRLKTLYYP